MTPTPPGAAVPAQPDALQPIFMEAMEWGKYFWAPNINVQAETLRVVAEGFARKAATTLTPQGAAERAVPAPMCLHCGATEGAHYIGRCGSVMGATRYTAPAHVQTPAQTEHVDADVSQNGLESNTAGAVPERIAATWLTDPTPTPERQFCEWLNSKRGCNVSEVFHEIMQRFASHAQAPAGATTAGATTAGAKTDAVMKLVDELVRATTSKNSTHAQYMGIAMPDDVYERFATLRDEFIPDLRDKLRAMVTPTAQAAPAAGAVAGPLIDQEATAYNGWFNGEQGTAYDGMWAVGRAAWMARAAAPTPAAQADSGVQEDAARKARLAGMHKFLEWNRGQGTARPVPGPCEYSVFNQAVDIYCAALAAKGQKP